ncbi:hypothetical protein HanIR_Chr08g0375371 [Helianthus annuus]|nr:hypothetical protein HanIR_Chr08g0375371 [Helianthus annuus]
MEAGFGQLHGYMEEQYRSVRQLMDESRRSHEAGQRRLEDKMRYMMENLNMGVPSYFQQSAQLGPSGMKDVQQYQSFGGDEEED